MLTISALLIIGLLILIDVIVFAHDRYDWSVGIMLATIVGVYFFTPYIKDFVESIGWAAIFTKYLPGYLIVGLGTAFVKWIIYSIKRVGKIRDARKSFDVKHPVAQNVEAPYELEQIGNIHLAEANEFDCELVPNYVPDNKALENAKKKAVADRRKAFVEYFRNSLSYKDRSVIYDVDFNKDDSIVDALTPRAKDNIGKITVWIFQWPIVIIATVFSDLLIKLSKTVATWLDILFSAFNRKLVANATKGM